MRHGKWLWIGLATGVTAVVTSAATWALRPGTAAAANAPAAARGFAVVELFTSEGCSSCPPADAQLSRLVAAARADGTAVYPLAFHVDYWNHGGWADRFSTAAASDRQRQYGQAFKLDSIYTPQAVVNGTSEFVGSNAGQLSKAVAAGLAMTPAATITAEPTVGGDTVHVAVKATGAAAGEQVVVALVERGLSTHVKGGENGGAYLRHDNVVRAFATAELPAGGRRTVDLRLPADAVRGNVSVIAFVQEPATMRIDAATGADLPR